MTHQEPTYEQLRSACLSFRHDFGLLDYGQQAELLHDAREWFRAWQKEGFALAAKPDFKMASWPNMSDAAYRALCDLRESFGLPPISREDAEKMDWPLFEPKEALTSSPPTEKRRRQT